ncbi:MAG: RNA polymerase sigma factor [Eubacterium sp.]
MADKLFAGLSFEQVVRKYSKTVAGVCVMHLQNWADAEDCFQAVFISLFSKSPEFNDENHLKAWLIRVAINECNNYIRKNRRLVSLNEVKEESVAFNEDTTDISWALMKLEPKYREVLYLHYCERYKVSEIAQILKRNPNTVKTMLKRGREKLRCIYGGDSI